MMEVLAGGTDGPYYDALELGDCFDTAPNVELTSGLAAAHHTILGGRLRLALDSELARRVTGHAPFAHPALVWDVSIGQSTLVTQRAIANLFYRGLTFVRIPIIGDTMRTVTTIVGLRPVTPKPGRPARGLVVMHIRTADQHDRSVLDYYRCAMLPARSEDTRGALGLLEPAPDLSAVTVGRAVAGWDLGAFRYAVAGMSFKDLTEARSYGVAGGDLVSSAPELARMTLNLAAIHHDRTVVPDGRRLVYGGHTIGLALAQVTRALPSLVTVLAWQGCDHTGPVHENDTLHAVTTIEKLEPVADGGLAHLRVQVRSTDEDGAVADVLNWRMIGLFA